MKLTPETLVTLKTYVPGPSPWKVSRTVALSLVRPVTVTRVTSVGHALAATAWGRRADDDHGHRPGRSGGHSTSADLVHVVGSLRWS